MSPGAPAQAQRGRAPVLTGRSACLADYVLALEAEIRTLKHKFQTLEEQLGGVLEPLPAEARPPADARPPALLAAALRRGGRWRAAALRGACPCVWRC